MPLAASTKLGPYEILAPLGAGGMGEVYRARDTRLGREVAIKVLPAHLIENAEVRARFEREARTISSLNHPHICTLHDVGREGDTDYLVMELVDGETLAQKLARGPLPPLELLKLATQIADALDRAHRAGIVHRDFKPGNVMVTRSGAKLMDFGLARNVVAPGMSPASGSTGVTIAQLTQSPTIASPLTQQGSLIGTFLYMSPEQLEGKEADARSDIWAFGCVLYEMATGHRAFDGKSQASLVGAIMNSEPAPLSASGAAASPALDALIRACLAKDPEERIQTAHDIKLQLSWLAQSGIQSGATGPIELPKRRRGHENIAWAVAALAILAAGFMTWRAMTPRGFGSEPVRFNVAVPPGVDNVDLPRISPDGRTMVFTGRSTSGQSMLWVRPLRSLTATPLAGTEGAGRAFWSPDSRFLAFFSNGKLRKIPASGGPVEQICDAPSGSDGSWNARGVILYDGGPGDPVRRVNASGGLPTVAIPTDSSRTVGWPSFLPDGEHFLLSRIGGSGDELVVCKLGDSTSKALGISGSRVEYAPGGYLIFVRDRMLLAQKFDTRALKLTGDPFPLADSLPTNASNSQANFSVSTNGVLLYRAATAGTSHLEWLDRKGQRISLVGEPGLYRAFDLAPDGKHVAIRLNESGAVAPDLWVLDLVRGTSTRFTFDPGADANPLWSRDGSKIFWSGARRSGDGILMKAASGMGAEENLLKIDQRNLWINDMSPDGSLLLYDDYTKANVPGIYVLPLAGDRKPRPIVVSSTFVATQGHFSPDGRRIAYCSNESGRFEIYVINFTGEAAKWQVSTGGGYEPHWRADGREIFYFSNDSKLMSVPIAPGADFSPGIPVPMFQVHADPTMRNNLCVTPDGQRFLFLLPNGDQTSPMTVAINWLRPDHR